jgi:prophage regulatory protein
MHKPLLHSQPILISAREVTELTTLSRTTLWRATKAKTFPAPVSISSSRVAWPLEEVQAWLADRCDARAQRFA